MSNIKKIKELLLKSNEKEVLVKDIEVFGYQYNYTTKVIGSINEYLFSEHEVKEYICPLNKDSQNHNRPGTKKDSIEYVVVHDTASAAKTADSLAHAKYVTNGGGGTSWHYSSGDDAIYHQVPDDEVAYHAGDGTEIPFKLIDTKVKYSGDNPKVEIIDGFYYINNVKSVIPAPKVTIEEGEDGLLHFASDGQIQRRKAPIGYKKGDEFKESVATRINDGGIRIDVIDGRYFMGPTYFSPGYEYISNRGGNLHSIGIETMVNEGSDLYLTWQKTAKLCAKLCLDNNLGLDRIKPHHFFSGKDCPMTLRHANLWDKFLKLCEVEYEILKLKDDIEIKLIVNNDLVDSNGRIKELPEKDMVIDYQVELIDKKTNEKEIISMESNIRGKLEYRKKTNDKLSVLGFGCMRFPTINGKIDRKKAEAMLDYAMEQGINYYDTAYMYHDGESERFLGEVLDKYDRNSYYLATKLPMFNVNNLEDAKRIFNEQLEKLHKDYFDYYLFHALDRKKFEVIKEYHLEKYFEELKKEGKIRHIGFSFHDDYEVFEEIVNYYNWDFCQIQFNYLDTLHQAGLKGLKLCEEKGIPNVIMEPIKGGALANLPNDVRGELDKVNPNWSSASWALRYVASFDNVMVMLSGMSSFEQVKDNINTVKTLTKFTDKEYKAIDSAVNIFNSRVKNLCTGCRYCMPCPFGVNIPRNFRVWNEIYRYENKNRYKWELDQIKAKNELPSQCTKCGRCETLCPQHIKIREDLEKVNKELFK